MRVSFFFWLAEGSWGESRRTPWTDSGPERETRVRATSPMRPTVPPPYTREMLFSCMTSARWRAASRCAAGR